jgi:sulfonate transport system substrate-binding protein
MTSTRTIRDHPDSIGAALRALARAQRELRADLSLATKVGEKLFPAMEAGLIAELIGRDLDYYTPAIADEALTGLAEFAAGAGLVATAPKPEQLVDPAARQLWPTLG